ncbi:MAG TPA: hypothetical protein VK993_12195, partial [Chthoniobacterales bacterium]|nr:hypothetical protein [Chthoniobacterales bacterium]
MPSETGCARLAKNFFASALLLALAASAPAATHTWTDNGNSLSFSVSGNWSGGAPVSSTTTDLVFTGTNNTGTVSNPLNQ